MDDLNKRSRTELLEDILAKYTVGNERSYRSARWLESRFDSPVWRARMNHLTELDWRVKLQDGTLLTSPKNQVLLTTLREWLIARLHADTTGGRLYAPLVEWYRFIDTLHCIDYMLLRADRLGILERGLGSLSQNDMRAMLATIASHRTVTTSIYGWPSMLSSFYRDVIKQLPSDCMQIARAIVPDIEDSIPDEESRLTDLSESEILLARCWLAINGHYRRGNNGYRLSPRLAGQVEAFYSCTLYGRSVTFPIPTELCIGQDQTVRTEYPRSQTCRPDDRCSSFKIRQFVTAVCSLRLLNSKEVSAPTFDSSDLKDFATSLDAKEPGRHRTLPHVVILNALRAATEYALQYGQSLVDAYLSLARAAHASGENVNVYARRVGDISEHLPDLCKQLGVRKWTIEPQRSGPTAEPALTHEERFALIRSNAGLYECLLVLYGAVHIVVGTLMARRVGELFDLLALSCLDQSATRLVFKNRKSGFAGMRETEARPIPPLGVRLIRILESLQSGLIEIGALRSPQRLFNTPASSGRSWLKKSPHQCFRFLDLFCDWSETPLDELGRRYYIRQHQLRRFFAMLFFWGGGFGGLDTLRWFLGHSRVEQVWRYITESVPGVTIRSVAAEWAVYALKHSTKEAEQLSEALTRELGVENFDVLDEEALQMHIEDLIDEGKVSIEPEFLDDGRRYRIAVIIRPKVPA